MIDVKFKKKYCNCDEAEYYTGLHHSILYSLVVNREIPHICVEGEDLIFEVKELDRFMQDRKEHLPHDRKEFGMEICNLREKTCVGDVQAILGLCDDDGSDHFIWVDNDGNVFMEEIQIVNYPSWYAKNKSKMLFRFETWNRGNGYVGQEAMCDDDWCNRILNALRENWDSFMEDGVNECGEVVEVI